MVSLWGLDIQGFQRAFLTEGAWTAWPMCHPSLKVLVQQGGVEGDALWDQALREDGIHRAESSGHPRTPSTIANSSHPAQKGDKAVSHVGPPRAGAAHRLHPQAWGASPWTDVGRRL